MEPDFKRRAGAFSWPFALVAIVLIFAALAAFIFLRVEGWPMRTAHQGLDEAERVARGVRDTFLQLGNLQPRITVNNRVYVEQTKPAAELTVVMRDIHVEHEMEHTWAGSTKRVKLHGTFTARAGFDLHNDVSISSTGEEIVVALPHAQLLGVDQKQVDVLEFEHGYWNRISATDIAQEFAALPQLAQQKAIEAALPGEAERQVEQQLKARLTVGKTLRLVFGPTAPRE